MNKVIAGLIVAFAAMVVSLGLAVPAQAYPDNPPTTEVSPPQVESATPSEAVAGPTSAALPSTGGPNVLLLSGGVALVLVGGTVVMVARRRQTV